MKNLSICSLHAVARLKTEAAMCVPAAALWSGMTSDQNIPAEGGKLSGQEMQHDDGGGARGRGTHCALASAYRDIAPPAGGGPPHPCPGETLPL